jgi:hypothetical protein
VAIFESEYPGNLSRSIASSLQADNKSTPETTITTVSEGDRVITKIESVSVEKLLPILDDILACQSLCEKTLNLVENGTED